MLDKQWAKKIKQLRIAANLTQSDVNKRMKNPYNMMSQFEIGKKLMTEQQRKLFFEIIGKPVDESIPVRTDEVGKAKAVVQQKSKGRAPKAKLPEPKAKPAQVSEPAIEAGSEDKSENLASKPKAKRNRMPIHSINETEAKTSDVRKLAISLILSVLSTLNDDDLIELALTLKKGKGRIHPEDRNPVQNTST